MADEPVTAWREPWTRRARRWARRNRTAVTARRPWCWWRWSGMAAVLAVQTRANGQPALRANSVSWPSPTGARSTQGQRRPASGQRARAAAVRPGHGGHQAVPRRGQRGPAAEAEAVRGPADRSCCGAPPISTGKLEGLLKGQTDPTSRAALGRAYYELGELTAEIGDQDRWRCPASRSIGGAPPARRAAGCRYRDRARCGA